MPHFFACLGCGTVDRSTENTSTLPSTGHSRHFLALDGKWLALKACLAGRVLVYLTRVWVYQLSNLGRLHLPTMKTNATSSYTNDCYF